MRLLLLAGLGIGCLIAADPLQAIFEQAAKDLSAGNYASAERGSEKVLAAPPNQTAAMGNLGVVYQRTHRTEKAIAIYERALKVNPEDEGILLNLGLVYFKHEDYGQAMPFFERVVAVNASNRQGRQLLATCQAYLDQPELAINELEALRVVDPPNGGTLFPLGLAYLKTKQPEKAKAAFEEMFATATSPAQGEFLIGKAYYESTLFDPPLDCYRR